MDKKRSSCSACCMLTWVTRWLIFIVGFPICWQKREHGQELRAGYDISEMMPCCGSLKRRKAFLKRVIGREMPDGAMLFPRTLTMMRNFSHPLAGSMQRSTKLLRQRSGSLVGISETTRASLCSSTMPLEILGNTCMLLSAIAYFPLNIHKTA